MVGGATAAGRARVVGYLYNENELRNAANVLLRVEQLTPSGDVAQTYGGRVVGDVISRDRMAYFTPPPASYNAPSSSTVSVS